MEAPAEGVTGVAGALWRNNRLERGRASGTKRGETNKSKRERKERNARLRRSIPIS